jgi:phosphate starvation-inducible PhoH-like protein
MSRKKMARQDRRERFGKQDKFGKEKFGKEKFKDMVIVKAMTPGQKDYILSIKNSQITICTGPAGSGKTAIAVGIALQNVLGTNPAYEKLIIMRPAKEACGESIGYLPGELKEKMSPWAAPIIDNMKIFIDDSQIKNIFWSGAAEIVPLAYCRGRSLNKSFIILDEAQSCTKEQILMALTRIGSGSKMVVNGDLLQSDLTGQNGLADALERLHDLESVAITQMDDRDIVRNPIISEILRRYQDDYVPTDPQTTSTEVEG